jgi:hypothetical protein
MKLIVKLLAMGIIIFGLAACSEQADENPTENPNTDNPSKKEEQKTIELTVQEVFQKAEMAYNDLKSLHAEMETQQGMEFSSADQVVDNNWAWDMKIMTKLDAIFHEGHNVLDMYQYLKTDNEGFGLSEMELYRTSAGVFEKKTETGVWMKLPDFMFDGISDSLGTTADPRLDPTMFEMYAEDFMFEQNDNEYILILTSIDEKFKPLVLNVLGWHGATDGGFDLETEEELLAVMSVITFDIEIILDKMTFNTIAFRIDLDIEIKKDDGTLRIIEKVKADISKINEINEIIVPQDILESAIEQPF